MTLDNEIPLPAGTLKSCGIQDPAAALRNLELLKSRLGGGALAAILPDLIASLRQAGDPDMALNHLERFVDALEPASRFVSTAETRPDVLGTLVALFGASRFLSLYLITAAGDHLELLSRPQYLAHPAGKEVTAARLAAALSGSAGEQEFFRALRRFRKQEMLRIGLRDLLGKADLAETVTELSNLAEVSLQAAYEWADADLRARHGRPQVAAEGGKPEPAGFAVIGMGKLGGGELNFSSDIDLMYVYTADGETEGVRTAGGAFTGRITNHQYFIKLAEKVSAAIGRATEDGFVFRVDLRLRPEGQRGPLAQSLGGYEIYYESWGQTWERSALIKARPVAGDEAVGREFIERITPFVYRKYLDFGSIAEIRDMKQKINREVEQKGKTFRDVKLGYGGIREIEFLVQTLQLIYGGRDRALRERSTLKALHALAQKGLLTYQETAELLKAYVFLRTVEHRIQVLNDLQTQTLPAGEAELRSLARRTGYLIPGREAEALLRDYAEHTRRVRGIYDELLSQAAEAPRDEETGHRFGFLLDPETGEREAVMVLAQYGFRDPAKAFRNIELLREGQAFAHQTPRSRRVFREIFPAILEQIVNSPDPDMALHHLESYLASQGSWDAFQSFIRHDLMAVRMLVSIFSNSEYFSRMLVRNPGLLDDLLDASREIGPGSKCFLREGLAAALAKAETVAGKLDALRRFKHREEIRIGMADLLSELPASVVWRGLSRLAEVCLDAALRLAAGETARRYGAAAGVEGLAVIGVGKLGGRELIYGSDLDILFVYGEERAAAPPAGLTAFEFFNKVAEKTLSYLTTMTREGSAYRVDTRLRPSGSKGPLVQSMSAWRNYYAAQAGTWERQALVNARCVAGDGAAGRDFRAMIVELIYRDGDAAALVQDIRSMRKRMEEELGREDGKQYNIKQGAGGLVDIEFLAQYLQLLQGKERPRVRVPGTFNALRALRKEGILPGGDYRLLVKAYLFLRQIESRMRIVANQSTSMVPRDPEKLRPLARRMGYQDEGDSEGRKLLEEYERTRNTVRGIVRRFYLSE
jgi:glutamate-ammonia-ligase adenylyltransferase